MWGAALPITAILALITPHDGAIGTFGMVSAIVLGIPYAFVNGIFFFRVWRSPSHSRRKMNNKPIWVLVAVLAIGFVGVQLIPSTVSDSGWDAGPFDPHFTIATSKGWGFPFLAVRVLGRFGGLGYPGVVIDYTGILANLLFGLFLFFVLHCWLCFKWHRAGSTETDNGQQDAAPNPGDG